MTVEFPRTSYDHAVRKYDDEFCRALCAAIVNAIAETSVITKADFKILMLRVGETLEADDRHGLVRGDVAAVRRAKQLAHIR